MGMSVSTTMGFENREFLMNSAKNMQNNTPAAEKSVNTANGTIMLTEGKALTTEQYIMLASTQITVNNSLKETLKYLQKHANNKKEYKFGDIWKILSSENEDSDNNPYQGELVDIIIDNTKNIFAA